MSRWERPPGARWNAGSCSVSTPRSPLAAAHYEARAFKTHPSPPRQPAKSPWTFSSHRDSLRGDSEGSANGSALPFMVVSKGVRVVEGGRGDGPRDDVAAADAGDVGLAKEVSSLPVTGVSIDW